MSASWRASCLPAAIARDAFSRRHSCHGPAKKSERPRSISSTAVATASRNQRSWATRITAASIEVSFSSSHSRLAHVEVVRRLVEQQQVGIAGQRAGERRAGQLSSGERVRAGGRGRRPRSRDRAGPRPPARASPSRRRARAAPGASAYRASVVASCAPPPSPASSARSSSSSEIEIRCARQATYSRSVRSRSSGGRWSCSAMRVPFENASSPPWHLRLTREHAQQRRLAGAVRPGEREPVAALDAERHAVEERRAAQLFA